jgi:hypothetical protein
MLTCRGSFEQSGNWIVYHRTLAAARRNPSAHRGAAATPSVARWRPNVKRDFLGVYRWNIRESD